MQVGKQNIALTWCTIHASGRRIVKRNKIEVEQREHSDHDDYRHISCVMSNSPAKSALSASKNSFMFSRLLDPPLPILAQFSNDTRQDPRDFYTRGSRNSGNYKHSWQPDWHWCWTMTRPRCSSFPLKTCCCYMANFSRMRVSRDLIGVSGLGNE